MRALAPHSPLAFELNAVDPSGARAGMLHTRRGPVPTPVFMPVATHATIRGLDPGEVAGTGTSVLLANTYHLMLRPGAETFERLGGIHRFMAWDRLVLTDSGGYQIFSLEEGRTVQEHGAVFRSFHDNSRRLLSPETSIATQQSIGSDIMMVLDECVASTVDEPTARAAMERTHRWALRCLAVKEARDTGQALFAIVQGAVFPHLRDESAAFLTRHPFDGFAIGGLAVGEEKHHLHAMTAHVAERLPPSRPRYLMGVGTPVDLVECVRRGVDMFDCIIPTKMAQQGYAYTFGGLLRITRSVFRHADGPLDPACDCAVCTRFGRGYLHHLAHGKHSLAPRLLALHNVRHYQLLTARLREAILAGRYAETAAELLAGLSNKKLR
ncbi:MAG TPA: tRNA guanosine(34) transglycosylase Tgt [Myxococcales bacterium]|nr:tRNA guanosine(34) transglycosylase Tgt [Myxococcales bacterium]